MSLYFALYTSFKRKVFSVVSCLSTVTICINFLYCLETFESALRSKRSFCKFENSILLVSKTTCFVNLRLTEVVAETSIHLRGGLKHYASMAICLRKIIMVYGQMTRMYHLMKSQNRLTREVLCLRSFITAACYFKDVLSSSRKKGIV